MGYRNYIGTIPKKIYNKIKSLTEDEVYNFYEVEPDGIDDENRRYLSVYKFGKELYEFGKYVDFNPPKGSIKTFFKKKETEKVWNDEDELKVVTKEFLKYIIESYIIKVRGFYEDMYKPFQSEDTEYLKSRKLKYRDVNYEPVYCGDFNLITENEEIAITKMINHIRGQLWEWRPFGGDVLPLQFDCLDNEKSDVITTSWKYEYAVFELIKIYKNFDWKKNVMIYYGY